MEAFITYGRWLQANNECFVREENGNHITFYFGGGAKIVTVKNDKYNYYLYSSPDGKRKERITKRKGKFCQRDVQFLNNENWEIEQYDYFKNRFAERST